MNVRTPLSRLSLCVALAVAAVPVWAQGLPKASPESVGMSSERLQRLSKVLKQEVDQGNLPGTVMLIARKGKLVHSEALGVIDPSTGKPMTADAIFRIYSMTKPLASVAAMILVEEGRLQLTDPVSKFLPSVKDLKVSVAQTDPNTKQVTYQRCRRRAR